MKRFFVFLLAASFFVPFLFFLTPSANAFGLDYNDYISDIVVDGDNDIVYVDIPVDKTEWFIFNQNGQMFNTVGSSVSVPNLINANTYRFVLDLPMIDLSDIPNGTAFSVAIDGSVSIPVGFETPRVSYHTTYMLSNGSRYNKDEEVYANGILFDQIYTYDGVINKDPDDVAFRPGISIERFVPIQDGSTVTLRAVSLRLTMTISSLLRLQQATGQTNKILAEVKDQLAEQGQTLDDIEDAINAPVSPVLPDQDSIVQDSIQQEEEILSGAADSWQESQHIFSDFNLSLSTLAVTFSGVSAFLNRIFALPAFSMLLSISLAIGVLASVLNMSDKGKSGKESDAKGKKKKEG